jgi:hypothetical protein
MDICGALRHVPHTTRDGKQDYQDNNTVEKHRKVRFCLSDNGEHPHIHN